MSNALYKLSYAAGAKGDGTADHQHAQSACAHARIAGDDASLGMALARLALTLPPTERGSVLTEAAELLTHVGYDRGLAIAYSNAAYTALEEDRVPSALQLLDRALEAVGRIDSPLWTMTILGNIGLAHLFSGDVRLALEAFERELTLCISQAFTQMGPPSQCSRLRGCLATRRGRGSTIRARMPRCERGSRPTLPALTISTGCDGRMGFAVRCVGGRRRGSCQTGGGRAESAGGGCRRRRGRSSTGRGRR